MPDALLDSHIVCKQQYSCHLKLRCNYFSLASIAVAFEWEELKSGHITFFFSFCFNIKHISATLKICRHAAFFLPKSDPRGLTG